MPAAIGPRFVLEAGFLILLAVVAGLAELRPALIMLVMAVGWLLVSLIEYFAWRQSVAFATVESYAVAEGAAPGPVVNEMAEDTPPPPPPPAPATPPPAPPEPEAPEPETPPPAEEETMVAASEAEPGAAEPGAAEPVVAEEVIDFRPEREINYRLDPLKPRPSRRWKIFGPRVRGEDDREEER
jgi:hypothetical protein